MSHSKQQRRSVRALLSVQTTARQPAVVTRNFQHSLLATLAPVRQRHHIWWMDTYAIVPRSGAYRVVATTESGKQTFVAAYSAEQDAMMRLKYLQEKAGGPRAPNRPKDWNS
jgi:hypothetical protein